MPVTQLAPACSMYPPGDRWSRKAAAVPSLGRPPSKVRAAWQRLELLFAPLARARRNPIRRYVRGISYCGQPK